MCLVDKLLLRVIVGIGLYVLTIAASMAKQQPNQDLMLTNVSINPVSAKSELYVAPNLSKKKVVTIGRTIKKRSVKTLKRTTPLNTMKCRVVKSSVGGAPAYVCDSNQKDINITKNIIKPVKKPITPIIPQKSVVESREIARVDKTMSQPIISEPSSMATKTDGYLRPYVNVVAGISLAKIGQDQQNGGDRYENNKYLSGVMIYGLGGGCEFNVGENNLLSLGLGIYQDAHHDSKGKVYDVDNNYDYNYNYNVRNTRFMAEIQLARQFILDDKMQLLPFLTLGIGPSHNYASAYEEQAVRGGLTPSVKFASNASITFAYQMGAGLACAIDNSNRLFVGYRYVGFGETQLVAAASANPAYTLKAGTIKTHEIYFGYTHLFHI